MNIIQASYPEVFTKPWLWSGYFRDFHTEEELTEFVVTLAASGTAAVIDTTASSARGIAQLSGAATTDNSGVNLQYDAETIVFATNKITLFTARVYFDESTSTNVETQSDFYAGLGITDTAWFTGNPTDGIYFRKDDGDAYLDVVIRRDGADVASNTQVMSIASDTWYTLEIVVDMENTPGSGTAYFYVNGAEVGRLFTATIPYEAEESMTATVEFATGDNTGTKWCLLDYVGAWVQR